ncbi:MAG: FAD-binding oxidoreductase [Alphaproteobacteria bacterium]|nr:FAD-binding oxidoreductase [Alphaproteobacteria bacterium]
MSTKLSAPSQAALDRIKAALGKNGWTDAPEDMAPHLVEPRGLYHGKAALIARPATTKQVSAVIAICNEYHIPVVPQGGNTSLVGAAVPDDSGAAIVLSLSRLDRIRSLDASNDTITVEAGCVLANVQAAAEEANRLFPLSLGAEGSCQIGGNHSTNAGGTAVMRYGNARALALGLEVVLPSGDIWDGLRALQKDNTGYDLKQLFIGAEGTLGVITAAVLRLFPLPRDVVTALVGVPEPAAAVELLALLRAGVGDAVVAFELISEFAVGLAIEHIEGVRSPVAGNYPWYVLVELASGQEPGPMREAVESVFADALDRHFIGDAVLASSQSQIKALWRLREAVVEAQAYEGASIKHDIAVPVSKVPEFLARADELVEAAMPGIRVCAFGHLGDGNIHYNLTQPKGMDADKYLGQWASMNQLVHGIADAFGGSISAEHGLGQLKREEIRQYKSKIELDLMRTLKSTLDPKGIMNPGKVV